jgi:hypothetical protein
VGRVNEKLYIKHTILHGAIHGIGKCLISAVSQLFFFEMEVTI